MTLMLKGSATLDDGCGRSRRKCPERLVANTASERLREEVPIDIVRKSVELSRYFLAFSSVLRSLVKKSLLPMYSMQVW